MVFMQSSLDKATEQWTWQRATHNCFLGSAAMQLVKVKCCQQKHLPMLFMSQGSSSEKKQTNKKKKNLYSLAFIYLPPVIQGFHSIETVSGWPHLLLCVWLLFIPPVQGRHHWFGELASLLATFRFSVMSWLAKEVHVHRKHQSNWGTQTSASSPQRLILQVGSNSSNVSPVITKKNHTPFLVISGHLRVEACV